MNSKYMLAGCFFLALLLIVDQAAVIFYAPLEASMGIVQKIFYLHLPMAWWAFFSFFLVFLASLAYLYRQKEFWDQLAASAAELGVLLSSMVLLTGMLWAKAAWNTWWTWNPRLSTTLIMWFVYVAYLILRHSQIPEQKKRTLCAVLGILAFLDVPLVFLSARYWRSVHPAVIGSSEGGMPPEMWHVLLLSIVAWAGVYLALLWIRLKSVGLESRLDRLIQH